MDGFAKIAILSKALKGHTDISYVVREFRDAFMDAYRYSAAEINCGDCEKFAYHVADIFPGARVEWDDVQPGVELGACAGHAFVIYRGRYYDSEAPEGVSHWKELPCEIRFFGECYEP